MFSDAQSSSARNVLNFDGLGQQAVRSALSKAFLHLRADRVVAKVMPPNLRSIRCIRACGFQQMAEMRA